MNNTLDLKAYQKQWQLDHAEERKAYRRAHYLKNKDKVLKQSQDYYQAHKAEVDARHKAWNIAHPGDARKRTKKWQNSEAGKLARKQYYKDNKKKIIKQQIKYKAFKYLTDPLFRATTDARLMVRKAISRMGYKKKGRTETIIGCSFEEFKNHIESKFSIGMTWLNHGAHTWHIDHIIPLASAKTEAEVIKLNHYTNLQPLWAQDNLVKGSNSGNTTDTDFD